MSVELERINGGGGRNRQLGELWSSRRSEWVESNSNGSKPHIGRGGGDCFDLVTGSWPNGEMKQWGFIRGGKGGVDGGT